MATQKDFSDIDSKHSISGRNFKFKFNTGNGARRVRATVAKDCVGFAKGVFSGLPWAVGEAGRGLRTARQTSEANGLRGGSGHVWLGESVSEDRVVTLKLFDLIFPLDSPFAESLLNRLLSDWPFRRGDVSFGLSWKPPSILVNIRLLTYGCLLSVVRSGLSAGFEGLRWRVA